MGCKWYKFLFVLTNCSVLYQSFPLFLLIMLFKLLFSYLLNFLSHFSTPAIDVNLFPLQYLINFFFFRLPWLVLSKTISH